VLEIRAAQRALILEAIDELQQDKRDGEPLNNSAQYATAFVGLAVAASSKVTVGAETATKRPILLSRARRLISTSDDS
jgi:hypothetical protein